MKRSVISMILIGTMAMPATVAAQGKGFVGLGVASTPDYEGSEDYEAWPVLAAKLQWDRGWYAKLGGTKGSSKAARLEGNMVPSSISSIWKFGPVLQYRQGRNVVDNERVTNTRRVPAAFELGGFVGLELDPWNAGVTVVQDVSKAHDGLLLELSGGYKWPVNDTLDLSFDVASTYADDDYMETYFGVDADNSARTGMPIFNAEADFKDVSLGLSAEYKPKHWNQWGLLGFARYTRLLSDAEDSPIVDDQGSENQFNIGVAATYRFDF